MSEYCAVIPARAGSKRLPGKNMRRLAGKPLAEWTLEAARKSRWIDEVVVTSDDEALLALAKRHGAQPLRRPSALAGDEVTTYETVVHAIRSLKKLPEFTVLLQPTSPLRHAGHIDEAVALLREREADAVISVTPAEHSPLWCNTLPPDGSMRHFLSEVGDRRGQELPVYYRLNGAIYIVRTRELLAQGSFFLREKIYAYVMEPEASVDIDTRIDFLLAELLLKERLAGGGAAEHPLLMGDEKNQITKE